MKKIKEYTFLTANELVEKLLYGEKKECNFTFNTESELSNGIEPTCWFGAKLFHLFDNDFPNCLAIGYWGGGDTTIYNLEWDDKAKYVTTIKQLEKILINHMQKYFADNGVEEVCVEM